MKNSQHKVSPTRLSLIILGFISFGSFFVPVLLTHATTVAPACSDPAPTCTMTASPSTIVDGNSSTLSWTSANVTSVTINQGIGSVSANSSKNVSPSTTTTYTGTFTGPGGSTTCSKTITVTPIPSAPTCTMNASPSTIVDGNSSTLSWTSANVTSVTINQGIGSVSANSSKNVSPSTTTTYTGTFTGPGGSTTCSKTITVTPVKPSCPFTAGPNDVIVNFSKTLLSNGSLSSAYEAVSKSVPAGNYIVKLMSYDGSSNRATATAQPNEKFYVKLISSSGSTLQTTSSTPDLQDYVTSASWSGTVDNNLSIPSGVVTVKSWHTVYPDTSISNSIIPICALFQKIPSPAPTCTMNASPSTIVDGNSSTLSWTSANVTSVTINQGIGSVSANSSKNVSPSTTTTYTGTFTGPGGSTTCSKTITVTPIPSAPTCTMNASPSTIVDGNSSTLSWTSANVTSVTINQGIGSVSANSSKNVSPSTTTTYTGTFTGPGGSTTCSKTITVTP